MSDYHLFNKLIQSHALEILFLFILTHNESKVYNELSLSRQNQTWHGVFGAKGFDGKLDDSENVNVVCVFGKTPFLERLESPITIKHKLLMLLVLLAIL